MERSRFTRRTATVTTSAPDASIARVIVSMSEYLPVPTMRRDWNVRPPIVSGVSSTVSTAVVIASPSTDKMHELNRIAGRDFHVAESWPAHDAAIVLDDHRARIELQLSQDFEQGRTLSELLAFSVHHHVHQLFHATNPVRHRPKRPGSRRSRTLRRFSLPAPDSQ